MAIIKVTSSPSGQSIYAMDVDGSKRVLLGYIGAGNVFFAARQECEPFHKQRWGEGLKLTLANQWAGKDAT